jgi:predicted ATPase
MQQAAFRGLIARGRDAELATLGSQLDRVRSGVGAVLLIEGGAGMGKSRLLEEGARIAERMSFRVGSGAAEPGEGIVELASLMEALFGGDPPLLDRSALRDLHALPEQRYWLLQDLQALLERAALRGPMLAPASMTNTGPTAGPQRRCARFRRG